MTTKTLLEKIKPQKIGKTPVVVLPLKVWRLIEEQIEELEMINANILKGKIDRARKEKSLYSSREVKKMLAL